MDTAALRKAYEELHEAASLPGASSLSGPKDGEWDVDQVLAHVLSVDAALAAAALAIVAGFRPSFDNRVSHDPANLRRIIAEHPGRGELADHVRSQGLLLCEVADQLSADAASVLVPALLVSHEAVVVDQPVPLSALIDGLAHNHLPVHAEQVRVLLDA
jgi:hypothetical protein